VRKSGTAGRELNTMKIGNKSLLDVFFAPPGFDIANCV